MAQRGRANWGYLLRLTRPVMAMRTQEGLSNEPSRRMLAATRHQGQARLSGLALVLPQPYSRAPRLTRALAITEETPLHPLSSTLQMTQMHCRLRRPRSKDFASVNNRNMTMLNSREDCKMSRVLLQHRARLHAQILPHLIGQAWSCLPPRCMTCQDLSMTVSTASLVMIASSKAMALPL